LGSALSKTASIIIDGAPRSGNRWLSAVVNAAFPSAFQKWGYIKHHNPDTFSKCKNQFDLVIAPVRNPKDSLTSAISLFDCKTNEDITKVILDTISILREINNNKNDIFVVRFEDSTQNISKVIKEISSKILLDPQPFDEISIKNKLDQDRSASFYSVPINNMKNLGVIKAILDKPYFFYYMKEAMDLYGEIVTNKSKE
jgi:hypothetical protein